MAGFILSLQRVIPSFSNFYIVSRSQTNNDDTAHVLSSQCERHWNSNTKRNSDDEKA